MEKVNLEIKCWENDYKFLLTSNRVKEIINNCLYDFNKKTLYINNVKNINKVIKLADKLIEKNIIDEYVIVDDYAKEVLDFFNINKESFNGGYYYSISELVGIFLCDAKYLLHFSSDSYMSCSYDFISPSIKIFNSNNNVIVSNPVWNKQYISAKDESIFGEDDSFFYGYGFSDQCYLIKTDIFKDRIYNEYNEVSERYPKYGGELFEKRVDSYMRNNNKLRITNKHCSYIHENIKK